MTATQGALTIDGAQEPGMTTADRERAADIDAILATMVERIVDRFDPERILLFGSQARATRRTGAMWTCSS